MLEVPSIRLEGMRWPALLYLNRELRGYSLSPLLSLFLWSPLPLFLFVIDSRVRFYGDTEESTLVTGWKVALDRGSGVDLGVVVFFPQRKLNGLKNEWGGYGEEG